MTSLWKSKTDLFMPQLPPPDFEQNVFINCPFDDRYLEILRPLLFTVVYLGFNPRIALERSDSGEQRVDKICELITQSKFSIHDLSRLQSRARNEYFRLNMPFELGIDYGVRRFAKGYGEKKFLILSKARFDYAKAISDISGVDIKSHEEQAIKVIRAVRNWLQQYIYSTVAAPQVISDQFNFFMEDFYNERKVEGFSEDDVYEITSSEIGQFSEYIKKWIEQKRNPIGPGLGPVAKIIDGNYYYTSSTLPDDSIYDYDLTVRGGQIYRNNQGKLIGEMIMRSPILSVQRLIERSGMDRETFESDDLEISSDPVNPTIFKARSILTYKRGDEIQGKVLEQDASYEIRTVAKGYLQGLLLKGTFDADFVALTSDPNFQGSGEFEIQVR